MPCSAAGIRKDAARRRGFTSYAPFDDFSVDTMEKVRGGGSAYRSIAVNGTPTPVGGCRFKPSAGDRVSCTWTSHRFSAAGVW
ncbi:hypothetical protein ACGFZK_09265 [Streptomyces sp. NPDC048257]|uniref:hypothetical protein n=1 Tax=Streptomyces sp. NPDC048257 TaxID=3365526 RepID=UPI003720ACA6